MADTKTSQQVSLNGRRVVDLVVPTRVNGELKAFAAASPLANIRTVGVRLGVAIDQGVFPACTDADHG